jgi:putative ATP-binding cassette transporter
MTQTASAFGQVQSALSFFIDNYTTLAELRAVMDRLKGLQEATDARPETTLDVVPQPGADSVGVENLTLALPTGSPLLENVRLELPKGQATLISGASGSGKSTLFRALAGIWPFGQGHVNIPAGARVLFLPQKPYIPIGTLRDAVKYPDEQSTASDARNRGGAASRQSRPSCRPLDDDAHWSNVLSGGEQQRWPAAPRASSSRLAVHGRATTRSAAPRAAFCTGPCPGATMISIGHRPTLQKWHDRRIELQRAAGEVGRLVEVPAT